MLVYPSRVGRVFRVKSNEPEVRCVNRLMLRLVLTFDVSSVYPGMNTCTLTMTQPSQLCLCNYVGEILQP